MESDLHKVIKTQQITEEHAQVIHPVQCHPLPSNPIVSVSTSSIKHYAPSNQYTPLT